jgi:hypothetical protein
MMTDEKKDGCCGPQGSMGPCCGGKKLVLGLIAAALIFIAGMLFARMQCPVLVPGNSVSQK